MALLPVGVQQAIHRQQPRLGGTVEPGPLAPQAELQEPLLLISGIGGVHTHRVEDVLCELDVLLRLYQYRWDQQYGQESYFLHDVLHGPLHLFHCRLINNHPVYRCCSLPLWVTML